MTFPQKKPKRERDPAYLGFIHELPCIACACEGREAAHVDAAHVSFLGEKGFGSKVGDRLCVALCREHHNEQHSMSERIWWARLGIHPGSLTTALSNAYPSVADAIIAIEDFAKLSRRTHRLRPAGELTDAAEAAPRRVTITAHLSDSRDACGNQGVILPTLGARGAGSALIHIDPSAIEEGSCQ